MKVIRYSVQDHPHGWSVWELCSDSYARGACRYELWCQCLHSDGGPLQCVLKVAQTVGQALEVCDVLEAALGGVREVNCEDAKHVRSGVLSDLGDWEVAH